MCSVGSRTLKHDLPCNAADVKKLGGFGHFYAYAPEKIEYPINRFTMEVKRLLDVLDRHLSDHQYLCGDD